MRATLGVPIRRVIRGTYRARRPPIKPETFPVSSAIEDLLSQPTWSVRSLLPPSKHDNQPTPTTQTILTSTTSNSSSPSPTNDPTSTDSEINSSKLHHLLRLSALPPPKTPTEEARMLTTLRDQIHFVKSIQSVDTSGVEPLITIRDETREAVAENTITLEKMMPYLALEEKVGKNGTVRRRDVQRSKTQDREERKAWEVDVDDLGVGSEKRRMGRYFFVRRGKKEGKDSGS